MARYAYTDVLQVFPFWMMDISWLPWIGSGGLPVFNPVFGFSSISSPEVTVETQEINEGNWPFPRVVVKRASISSISVQRGESFMDSDFYNWVMLAVTGSMFNGGIANFVANAVFDNPATQYRRNIMLVQFFARNPMGSSDPDADYRYEDWAKAYNATSTTLGLTRLAGEVVSQATKYTGFEFAFRVPARAWILKHCIPTRWKAAGDFNASDSSVSIMELDFACEVVEEVNLGMLLAPAIATTKVARAVF